VTRTRSVAGVDRRLAALAAIVMLAGGLLPWFAWSGELPSEPRRGWEGSGILVMAAAAGVLALLAFPWALRDEGASTRARDRTAARSVPAGRLPWLLLAGVAALGLVVWPLGWLDALDGLLPTRAPGLYVALLGTLMLAIAAVRAGDAARR
jgi:hypothetical protein